MKYFIKISQAVNITGAYLGDSPLSSNFTQKTKLHLSIDFDKKKAKRNRMGGSGSGSWYRIGILRVEWRCGMYNKYDEARNR